MKMMTTLTTTLAASLFALAGSVSAAVQPVATIKAVNGSVVVERANGKRIEATRGTQLVEGDRLMVLEGAKVDLRYLASSCNTAHGSMSLLQVAAKSQCAAAKSLGVGQAGAGGAAAGSSAGGAAAGAGGAAAGAAAGGTVAAAAGGGMLAGLGAGALAAIGLGVVAVGAAIKNATDDDDDNNDNNPISN